MKKNFFRLTINNWALVRFMGPMKFYESNRVLSWVAFLEPADVRVIFSGFIFIEPAIEVFFDPKIEV